MKKNYLVNILLFIFLSNPSLLKSQIDRCAVCNIRRSSVIRNFGEIYFIIKHNLETHVNYLIDTHNKHLDTGENSTYFKELLKLLKWIKYKPEIEVYALKKSIIDLIIYSEIPNPKKFSLICEYNLLLVFVYLIFQQEPVSLDYLKNNFQDFLKYFDIKDFPGLEDFIIDAVIDESFIENLADYYFNKARDENFLKNFTHTENVLKAYKYANIGCNLFNNNNCKKIKNFIELVGIAKKVNDKGIVTWHIKPKFRGDSKKFLEFSKNYNDSQTKALLTVWFLEDKKFALAKMFAESILDDEEYSFNSHLVFSLMKATGVMYNDTLINKPNMLFPDLVGSFKHWLKALENYKDLSHTPLGDNSLFLKVTIVLAYQLEAAFKDKIVTITKELGGMFLTRLNEELHKVGLKLLPFKGNWVVIPAVSH